MKKLNLPQGAEDWDGDKSTTNRASGGVEQNKAKKIETVESTQQRASDSRCWANQSKKDWDGDVCLQRAERLEALSKTKQDLRLTQRQLVNNGKCNVSAPWGRFNYLTDNTATVHPNT